MPKKEANKRGVEATKEKAKESQASTPKPKQSQDTHEVQVYDWKKGVVLDNESEDDEPEIETEYTSEQDSFEDDTYEETGDKDEEEGEDEEEDEDDEDNDEEEEEDEEDEDDENEDEDEDADNEIQEQIKTSTTKTLVEESDSSEEEVENRVGEIPMWWYDDYNHVGYDVEGKKVIRKTNRADKLDEFLQQNDEDGQKMVYDEVNDKYVRLTEEEVEMIRRIQKGQVADPNFDPYEDFGLIYDNPDKIHPLMGGYEPKSRFIPSKWEAKAIVKLVRAIRRGELKPKTEKKKAKVFDIWKDSDPNQKGRGSDMPAPKVKLPGHAESYNPPDEYLPTPKEAQEWIKAHPEDRETNFLPQKFSALRNVPAYAGFIKERFERCLDLYLCPRAVQKKANIDPESLIPKLPSPSELKPFPTEIVLEFLGHTSKVRSICLDHSGQYFISGSDDNTARIWEVSTGRCCFVYQSTTVVQKVAWSPNANMCVVALASGNDMILLNPRVGGIDAVEKTEEVYSQPFSGADANDSSRITWRKPSTSEKKSGVIAIINHPKPISHLSFHSKGDYLASICSDPSGTTVGIHHIQKLATQIPFRKNKEAVQCVKFHPSKAQFFVATQKTVNIYDLMKQKLIKKMNCGVKWISSLDIHPGGDNFLVGSYDRRVVWMDLDYASKPYKIMRNHYMAVRQVVYHKRYPLFASCSDDCAVHVFHNTVYDDLSKNALIVPLKILRGHRKSSDVGILDCQFHPTQPWIFTAGADTTIKLYA